MAEDGTKIDGWYAVRCIFELLEGSYEERITLWRAPGFDEAIGMAEDEADAYARSLDAAYLGIAQAYDLFDEPGHGAEVFSLIRDSDLGPDDYIDRFVSTGSEHQDDL
jgi:hypothetical protein